VRIILFMTSEHTTPQLTALGDPARWRIVELLATRPRSVGVVAQLSGLRQPQATKHLQTLERAGLVTGRRSAQRRYYLLDPEPLRALAAALTGLADTVEANQADFDSLDEYVATVDAERLAADRPRWADERTFEFDRRIQAPREVAWRYLTQTDLLAAWWAPRGLRMSRLVFDAAPGGHIVQEYVEADDADGSAGVIGRAEGTVTDIDGPERLRFRLSPLLPDGTVAFTGYYDIRLREDAGATVLDVNLRIADSTIDSADFIAGIELGWSQSLDALVTAASAANPSTDRPSPTKEHK
jgi:uncharacterized protein YndB with AHSA1/START domain/DNA-binding transcriptional ArsR family regulator